ncbi:MAG TPA: glycosyltransferase family 2 protein [Gammaproteobacteria bacterium]
MKRASRKTDVSVIMPAYNAGRDILESILCVQAQTYRALELLVIDDASSDDTWNIVERLARDDARIRLMRNDANRGVSASRNRGIENARGRFLMFLDSDDLWERTKVETQVAFMREHECAVSYMDYMRFRDANRDIAWLVTAPEEITYRDLLASNDIGMLTAAVDRHNVFRLPTFKAQGHEDYTFWLDLMRDAPAPALKVPTPAPLACYRERENSVSSNRLRSAVWHWNILCAQKQALPRRCVLMAQYAWRALNKRRLMRRYVSGMTR